MAVLLALPPAAPAQDAQLQGLIDRIDRLQRELITLQRQVYRGEAPPAPAELPAEAGPPSTTAMARIELRLSQFENELRSLTGQIEEASFRYSQMSERLDRLAADLDFRLQRLEQATPGLAALPGSPGTPGAAASLAPPSSGAPMAAPGTPGVIGTVDPAQVQALRTQQAAGTLSTAADAGAQQAAASALPPGGTPKEQYDHAFGLLSQANYDEAEAALRAFVEQHPKDPLAGNAKYWLGETYYVRGDYQQAAVTFAEAYQEYPDNSKAPDNLLKLGLALGALGNKSDACGTLSELLKRYKNAAITLIQRAKQEQQRLGC
ncbi:MAG TPA: tol-pal system protein YbgF [Kiloniellales bacterium]